MVAGVTDFRQCVIFCKERNFPVVIVFSIGGSEGSAHVVKGIFYVEFPASQIFYDFLRRSEFLAAEFRMIRNIVI